MANIPQKIEKFRDHQKDFGTSIAEALWKKAAQLSNYLDRAYPIGMIMYFHATQDNLPSLPDSRYWQELDGTAVTNVNSLLFGQTLPDMRDKFFRHPTTGDVLVSEGGQDEILIGHDHGGVTGTTDPRASFQMDDGGERQEAYVHFHTINSSLDGATTLVPRYIALKLYIRIA